MRKVLILLNIVLVIATVMAYYSPAVSPERFWPVAFTGLLFPFLLFFNIFFILLWLSFRRRWFILSLVCLLLGLSKTGNFIQLRFTNDKTTGKESNFLTVGSFNALKFFRLEPNEEGFESRLKDLSGTLHEGGKLDILCLQEGRVDEGIKRILGFSHDVRVGEAPVYILSNYPAIDSGVFDFEGDLNYCGWADLEGPGVRIRVYNIHLYSNLITNDAEQLMEERNFNDSRTWYSAGEIMRRYKSATIRRAGQAEVIRQHIDSSPYPVIVCGDFNDVPLSYVYGKIKGKLQDSFESCGTGIGATYNGRIPGLRIDHILTGEPFRFASHSIIKGNTSDHHPIKAKIRIREL